MRESIRQAFDPIRAEEPLKADTRRFVHSALEARRGRRAPARLAVACAAACCLLALLAAGGWLWLAPTTVISIDVNPSLELGVNRFDRVVSVQGYNPDGEALAEELRLFNLPYAQAVDQVLATETVTDCLARQEELTIAVVETDPDQGAAILACLSERTSGQTNAFCYGVAREEVAGAHEAGLSYGKYKAFTELLAYDPTLTPDQVAGLTMRQLRQWLAQLQAEAGEQAPEAPLPSPGAGQGGAQQGSGQGAGAQNGAGHRYGAGE